MTTITNEELEPGGIGKTNQTEVAPGFTEQRKDHHIREIQMEQNEFIENIEVSGRFKIRR